MIYVYVLVFTIFAIINLIRGRRVRIRTVINNRDFIYIIFLWFLLLVYLYFFKSHFKEVLILTLIVSFYLFTSIYARGITEDGIIVKLSRSFINKEYQFSKIKDIAIRNEAELIILSIALKTSDTDVQRYPIARKVELIKILKDNNISFTYK